MTELVFLIGAGITSTGVLALAVHEIRQLIRLPRRDGRQ